MVITDRYNHHIDEKNRLAIPSQIRNAMEPDRDGKAFYLVPEQRFLQLIPEKLFEQLAGLATAGLSVPPEVQKARRLMFSTATRVQPDSAGRIVVPDRFMADTKNRDPFTEAILSHDVTLVGVGDRVEIWNQADYAAHLRELIADRHTVTANAKDMFSAVPPPSQMTPF